ncbi:hypothetical protein IEQ34_013864 [Dendrobium chrysotoxum]|uniref:Uncharacterized protein n=1 Tax=Dendrobium chrysotoxum TaxID=161865 RepID=A0AAV7G9T3_DENCH|nr:hypothetical protein IEQ34_013864 [Dendrobium chrysotoxum]
MSRDKQVAAVIAPLPAHLPDSLRAPIPDPPYTWVISDDHLPSRNPAVRGDPVTPPDGERRLNKGARADDAASTITGNSLIILYKKFHIPNDVVTKVPKRPDQAGLPPPRYLTICETCLRAGLHFPPPVELIKILVRYGITLSQFLYRAMLVTMGLIALFRDRGVILTPKHLSRMG